MRIARNLRGFRAPRQALAQGGDARGFTLVELMVTVTIMAIIMTIAVNAWSQYRQKTRVKSAAEEIRSVLTSARLRALSTRSKASVTFDFANEKVLSSLWSAPRTYKGVDLEAFTCSTGTAYPTVTANTMSFTPKGTVSATASNGKMSVLVRPRGAASPTYYLVVNNVTGSVKMVETCP